jgi:hypothetical protein
MKVIYLAAVLMLTSGARPEVMDSLSLTELDQQMAWNDITSHATKEAAPEGFSVKRGLVLPQAITTEPVPVSAANKVPDLRPYHYALLDNGELLIVNPFDRMVVTIIRKQEKAAK